MIHKDRGVVNYLFLAYDSIMMLRRNCFFAILCVVFAVLPVFSDSKSPCVDDANECTPEYPPLAIINASYRGDIKIMQEILAAGVDRDVRDAMGATALHEAMFQPNIMAVKLLLENGFDPNARATKNGCTPLHFAVAANNLDAAKLLLQYGANKRIKCLQGFTPLDKAKQSEKGAFINLLR
jgi:ankyrin repeat protein